MHQASNHTPCSSRVPTKGLAAQFCRYRPGRRHSVCLGHIVLGLRLLGGGGWMDSGRCGDTTATVLTPLRESYDRRAGNEVIV